jgi:hypothetical protein
MRKQTSSPSSLVVFALLGIVALAFLPASSVAAAEPASAPGGANVVANGSFEQLSGGVPSDWITAGDPAVVQTLTADAGKVAQHCAKLQCTAFERKNPSSHAMLAQVGKVALTKGQMYRFSCWMRAEGLAGRHVDVAVSDTAQWGNCGLSVGIVVGRQWRRHESYFTASRTVDKASRLQIWFGETGTLWVDDVRIEPVSGIDMVFTQRIEPTPWEKSRNLLPNGSFEAGADGWSSLGKRSGWGNLSALVGQVQANVAVAHDGLHCLRIDLGPGKTPVTYFDYFDPVRVEQQSPLAANVGWIKVEKGRKYTLSAWMRADRDGVPGVLMFRMSDPSTWINDHPVKVTLTQPSQFATKTSASP